MKGAILISGAGSGIGKATREKFKSEGSRVFSLDIRFSEECEDSIAADVTSPEELIAEGERLKAEGVQLDAIVIAAGIHTMASLAEADPEVLKRVIDVNLIGAMNTVRAFHPLLKKSGRVIIVTSEVATYAPMPFNGLYNISKTALECYADALRQELNLIGQKVIAVRPGAVETPLAKGSANSTQILAQSTELYKNEAKHFCTMVAKFTSPPIAPAKIADIIFKAATAKRPKIAYSKNRHPGLVMLSILPKPLQCFIIKTLLKRK